MQRLTIAPSAVAASAGMTAPAEAGHVQRVWDALPPGVGERILDGYLRDRSLDTVRTAIDGPVIDRLVDACVAASDDEKDFDDAVTAAALAFNGSIYERSALVALAGPGGVPREVLEQAWNSLSADDRALIGDSATTADAAAPQSGYEAIVRAVQQTGWRWSGKGQITRDPVFLSLIDYFLGRGLRETGETRV